jgi:predicted branched-subunit amino acid permease
MERHFRTLGYLFIVYAVWVIASILIVLYAPNLTRARTGPIPTLSLMIVAAFIVLYLIAGWSLLTRKDWGRSVTIAASIVALFSFPLGTALGIYGLWAMFSARGKDEYYRYSRPGRGAPGEPMPG